MELFNEQSKTRVRFGFQSSSLKYLQCFVKRRKKGIEKAPRGAELNRKTEKSPDFYHRDLRYHFQADAESLITEVAEVNTNSPKTD